jgi:O-glycosyl hydrolase
MKKIYFLFITLILSSTFPEAHAQRDQQSDSEIQVKIDPSKSAQTIEGWGSSLCWWAGQVGNWEESKVDSLIDLITSPDGLNMNIFRYNIGGGDDPSHIDGHMVQGKGKRAEMEGFKDGEDVPYNWKADAAQRKIMLKIREKRPDAIFEAFSNSPPYWMTFSGCSAGNVDPKKDNLKPEYYEAFCDYLIDVCKHYKDEYGIEFKTLEPFNESTSGYWNYLGSQEGCHFEPETQIKIIRLLYPKLKASGLKTVISASDETNLASSIRVLKKYMEAGDILDKIAQFNTHTYTGTNAERIELRELVKQSGKEFWQSETGPQGLPRRARGLENNLLLAQKMFYDLNLMQPEAWLDWQLMEENNDVWGLIKCNFKTEEYEIVKNLYVRMQITRFIKQGYTIVETNNESTLAAINPEKTQLVVAMNNSTETQESFKLNLDSFSKNIKQAEIYRTSKTEDCKKLPALKVKNQALSYVSPALSLTTVVVQLK